MAAVIRALLPTQLELTVHFTPEIHLILFQTSVKVLKPSFWADLAMSEHKCQQKMEPDGALVLKN